MEAAAVGAFDLQEIDVFDGLRIAQDIIVAAADIAAENVPEFFTVLADIEDDLRRTKNMAHIAKGRRHAIGDLDRTIVIERDELTDGLFGVGDIVERFDRRQPQLGALARNELGVRALNFRRIFQHDRGEIARRESAINVPGETMLNEVRKIPAMIDVRMAEDRGINRFRIEMERAIARDHFFAMPLEEPALHQNALAIDLDEELRPGCCASGPEKMNAHARENDKPAADCKT